MSTMSRADRARLSESIEQFASEIAEEVTGVFLALHPDWVTRYGDRARKLGIEDAVFHLRFLAGSVVSGEPDLFEDYVRWTAGMLSKRSIGPEFLFENIEQIRAALRTRLTPSEMAALEPYFAAGLSVDTAVLGQSSPAAEDADPLELTRNLFTQAILRGERAVAVTILLEALHDGVDPVDIYVDVLQQALYRVGRLWESNEISVAEEHMATAITQFAIASIYPRLKRSSEARGSMLLTGTQGELHQVGAMMLADVLEADGWDIRFLGANMPPRDIIHTVGERKPAVLGVSTTMVFNLPGVTDLIDSCRALPGCENLRIIVGGGAYRRNPALYQEVGADGYAPDLRSAREQLREWSSVA